MAQKGLSGIGQTATDSLLLNKECIKVALESKMELRSRDFNLRYILRVDQKHASDLLKLSWLNIVLKPEKTNT